jgi:hypothetical protein
MFKAICSTFFLFLIRRDAARRIPASGCPNVRLDETWMMYKAAFEKIG